MNRLALVFRLACIALCAVLPAQGAIAQNNYQFIRNIGALDLSYIADMMTDESGSLYIADTGNNRIQKFDSSGNYLFSVGAGYNGVPGTPGMSGSGNGQCNRPYSVSVDNSGNIYVADTFNNRVQKFDSSGNYLFQFGKPGSGNGQFNQPQGVTVDSGGNIYVADAGNSRIQKFDSNGAYLLQFGSSGSGNGQFSYLDVIKADSSGSVYAVDFFQQAHPEVRQQRQVSPPILTAL